MKKNLNKPEATDADLSDDLRAFLESSSDVTTATLSEVGVAAAELDWDAEFQADYWKAKFVSSVLEAMHEEHISQSDLASQWGRARQYVNKILNEDKRVNFTIETMVELATLLKRRFEIHVLKRNEAAHFLHVRTPAYAVPQLGFFESQKIIPFIQPCEEDYATIRNEDGHPSTTRIPA